MRNRLKTQATPGLSLEKDIEEQYDVFRGRFFPVNSMWTSPLITFTGLTSGCASRHSRQGERRRRRRRLRILAGRRSEPDQPGNRGGGSVERRSAQGHFDEHQAAHDNRIRSRYRIAGICRLATAHKLPMPVPPQGPRQGHDYAKKKAAK